MTTTNEFQFIPIPENKVVFPEKTPFRGSRDGLLDSHEVALEAIRTSREVARIYFQSTRQRGRENVIDF
jgi:hypothetical protein